MENRPYIFISPSKYVQGAGAIGELGAHVAPLGDRVLVLGGKSGLAATRAGRAESFAKHNLTEREEPFGGESSEREIARVADIAKSGGFNVLMACGGGKAIDTTKAAAAQLGLPCAVVPTVASNDSPCSSLSVIYGDDGTFDRLLLLGRNPDLVLVDTAIIAAAPVRQLVSGMGDALATWFEAEVGYGVGAINVPGGLITQSAMALAKLCADTLFEFGVGAKIACENNIVTPALERVVEANTLLSGIGFESGSVSIAHALSSGLAAVPGAHEHTHGELVAFCLLTQLIMQAASHETVTRVFGFCKSVGLPTTLADIGAQPGEPLRRAAEVTAGGGGPSGNLPFPCSARAIYDAMISVDAVGRMMA
ncbi:MAG: glycerol dehydrogenase [Oscillospiraceae bacterium]|nr:glycerol dehydrogenase [Oscillospiraceae bacterium]